MKFPWKAALVCLACLSCPHLNALGDDTIVASHISRPAVPERFLQFELASFLLTRLDLPRTKEYLGELNTIAKKLHNLRSLDLYLFWYVDRCLNAFSTDPKLIDTPREKLQVAKGLITLILMHYNLEISDQSNLFGEDERESAVEWVEEIGRQLNQDASCMGG